MSLIVLLVFLSSDWDFFMAHNILRSGMHKDCAFLALQAFIISAEGVLEVVGLRRRHNSGKLKRIVCVGRWVWQLYSYVSGCTYLYNFVISPQHKVAVAIEATDCIAQFFLAFEGAMLYSWLSSLLSMHMSMQISFSWTAVQYLIGFCQESHMR